MNQPKLETRPESSYRTTRPDKFDVCPSCGKPKVKICQLCKACRRVAGFPKRKTVHLIEQPADPSIRHISLSKGYVAIVDESDYGRVSQFTWQALVRYYKDGSIRTVYGYRSLPSPGGQSFQYLHRLILEIYDPAIQVDHRSGNGLNCRRSNLRTATAAQNMHNGRKRSHATSAFKGVSWHKQMGKWRSCIQINGKQKSLGLFATAEAAARHYDLAASEAFGEYARLNFPPIPEPCS